VLVPHFDLSLGPKLANSNAERVSHVDDEPLWPEHDGGLPQLRT
jgi:hypothetical protein